MAAAEAESPGPMKKSDLGVRTLSAIVMLAVAGSALWLGGLWWAAFAVIAAAGVLYEWQRLVAAFSKSPAGRAVWTLAGTAYVLLALYALVSLRWDGTGYWLLVLLFSVVGVDVGAYFMGRALGGPKIAPSISPSKTWAGLFGGILGAYVVILLLEVVSTTILFSGQGEPAGEWAWRTLAGNWGWALLLAAVIAVIAQAGDFFESWMKRRAGVKDSSNLIPGHGGLFDRADGLIAVSALVGLVNLAEGLPF